MNDKLREAQTDYFTQETREREAAAIHERIVTRQRALEYTFLEQGEDLYRLYQTNLWEVLGYATFDAYVSSPETNIGRRMAYVQKGCYSTFVLLYELDRDMLVRIGISKLEMIRPVITGYDLDQWLAKAETLSRSDLGIEIAQHLDRLPEEEELYGEDGKGGGGGTRFLVSALAALLNKFLELRPDYGSSPVVRQAQRALREHSEDAAARMNETEAEE